MAPLTEQQRQQQEQQRQQQREQRREQQRQQQEQQRQQQEQQRQQQEQQRQQQISKPKKGNFSLIFLMFLCALVGINAFGQNNTTKFKWELEDNAEKIHLNHVDIGIWIKDLDTAKTHTTNLKIVSDKFSNQINARFISFDTERGCLIKLDIKSGRELIGIDRKILIIDGKTNFILGFILVPIGSDAPVIETPNSKGQLSIDGASEVVSFKGKNLDGITEIISADGKVIVDSIISDGRTPYFLNASIKANSATFATTTSYSCKYREFDPATLSLKEKTTPVYSTKIGIYESSSIELEAEPSVVYAKDISDGTLSIAVRKNKNSSSVVDFGHMDVLPNPILNPDSWIKSKDTASGELHLVFKDATSLVGQKVYFELKAAGVNGKTYKVGLHILPEPKITSVENGKGELKYVINKDIKQSIVLHGENLDDVFVVPVQTDFFKVPDAFNAPSRKDFTLSLKSSTFTPGEYGFVILRGNFVIGDFNVVFEEPKVPQEITSLFKIKQGASEMNPQPDGIYFSLAKSDDVKLVFDPEFLKDGYGPQSLNIVVNYYNEDGSLITSVNSLEKGNSDIIIQKEGNPHEVKIELRPSKNDYVRPWGRADIIISHTADFYKQQLFLKQVYTQTIYFTGRSRVTTTASLTIPPALMIYGKDSLHRLELLPINVGFGLNFSFRKGLNDHYLKRNFEVGAYFAGLNFAGEATKSTETTKTFINKGDIAMMVLGQINLRRTDNFVKIPILFGPGFTFPIAGATCRGFIAFGVGVNF